MRKLTAGALIALAFLALTAVIVSQSLPTQASDESSKPNASIPPLSLASVASSDAPSTNAIPPRPQALAASVEAEKQPFIGITIETLDDGGVVVRSVLEDGPSDGHLQVDDIITHIDGNEMTSVSDVVEAVKASEPGDVLSFDVIRGDASISVEVVVGEREARFGRFPKRAPFQHQILGQLLHLPDNFVKAELMWDTDDGVKTVRAIAGTIADLNVDAGEFNLIPTDGSDKIFYKINDDTKVMTQKKGDLSGLNDEDRTVVVDVTMNGESDVKLVRQSEARERRGRFNMDIQIGGEGLFRMLPGAPDNFLRGELVWETDDGFKTTRAVAGVIKDLDIDNGKFVLDPADGSDTISYEINDDTNVITRKKGDLSGLNEEDRTLVIDVIMGGESTVKMVQQGEKVGHFQMRGHNGGFKFQFGQHDGFPSGIEGLMDRLPELQERLRGLGKDLERRFQRDFRQFQQDDSTSDSSNRQGNFNFGALAGSTSDFLAQSGIDSTLRRVWERLGAGLAGRLYKQGDLKAHKAPSFLGRTGPSHQPAGSRFTDKLTTQILVVLDSDLGPLNVRIDLAETPNEDGLDWLWQRMYKQAKHHR